jgi:hypothetical protein
MARAVWPDLISGGLSHVAEEMGGDLVTTEPWIPEETTAIPDEEVEVEDAAREPETAPGSTQAATKPRTAPRASAVAGGGKEAAQAQASAVAFEPVCKRVVQATSLDELERIGEGLGQQLSEADRKRLRPIYTASRNRLMQEAAKVAEAQQDQGEAGGEFGAIPLDPDDGGETPVIDEHEPTFGPGWAEKACGIGPRPAASWTDCAKLEPGFLMDLCREALNDYGSPSEMWTQQAMRAYSAMKEHNPKVWQTLKVKS